LGWAQFWAIFSPARLIALAAQQKHAGEKICETADGKIGLDLGAVLLCQSPNYRT
jgi:hypothetical protein